MSMKLFNLSQYRKFELVDYAENTEKSRNIFEDIDKQKEAIHTLLHIDERRMELNIIFNDPC